MSKLEWLLGEIEREAFAIPAPNPHTPKIVQYVIEAREAFKTHLKAQGIAYELGRAHGSAEQVRPDQPHKEAT